ncbi:MAG: hypothetical protein KatS3mg129_1010 [Leptospiraceae bacterium]|nr:MAG: hypothetical protein KatS3mg129_1010 [Leptospiraceae bacterium]
MELDQKIFKFFWNKLEQFKQKKDPPYTVYFDSIKEKIQFWARTISGYEIEIGVHKSNPYGGCCGNLFYYPEKVSLFTEELLNQQFYLYRTLYMCEILKQKIFLTESIDLNTNKQLSIKYFSLILNRIFSEYPLFIKIWEKINVLKSNENTLLYLTGLLYPTFMIRLPSQLKNQHITQTEKEIKTELKGTLNIDQNIEIIEENKEKIEEYTLMHNFEKIETIEEFLGNWRDLDGEDELEEHSLALDEVKHQFVIRTQEKIHSIFKTEFSLNGFQQEIEEQIFDRDNVIYYDEWDEKKRTYKKNYVKLYPLSYKDTNEKYYINTIQKYKNEIHKLKKIIHQFYNKTIIKNKQYDGIDIDYDSYVNFYSDLVSKKTPDERIYQNKLLKERDFAIILLLDQSLSTDGYVDNHRIIDLEKEAIIVLGEVLKQIPVYISIASFYSKTRNQIYYNVIKNFNESWDKALFKIGSIQPEGYTRIGAAIRHANTLINQFSYTKKWVILLSDGKPNDYDKYEGKYGIYDIKQAIREGRKNNIQYFGIALEKEAKFYLPLMFGTNHYKILNHPQQLLDTLTHLILKISYKD